MLAYLQVAAEAHPAFQAELRAAALAALFSAPLLLGAASQKLLEASPQLWHSPPPRH